ncbi:MAG: transposase [Desulfobulbus sp.]
MNSERGICWRCSDSLSLRELLGLAPSETMPDHSSLCRIRQRLPLEGASRNVCLCAAHFFNGLVG